jgi:hypothetical protein
LSLPSAQRAAIETKTLSFVRFVSKFFSLDFEGLILEFIFDGQNRAILHACWAATVFGNEPRRKILPPRLDYKKPKSRAPKVFPVPEVESEADENIGGGLSEFCTSEGEQGDAIGPLGLASLVQEIDARSDAYPQARSQSRKQKDKAVQECILLLEVWDGDEFLGEAALSCDQDTQLTDHVLSLGLIEEGRCLRKDDRKNAACGTSFGVVMISLLWRSDNDSADLLHFGPVSSQGLRPDGMQSSAARAVLWMKAAGHDEFSPVWASREVQHAVNPAWNETVDLTMPSPVAANPASQRVEQPTSSAVGSAGAAVKQRRPLSAKGRLESPTAFPSASVASATTSTFCARAQSEFGPPQGHGSMQSTRESPIELETSISSPHDLVLGAELSAHWGMSDTDGNMCTHVLASQVLQRLKPGGMNASTRSALLMQLSGQLQEFQEVQLS